MRLSARSWFVLLVTAVAGSLALVSGDFAAPAGAQTTDPGSATRLSPPTLPGQTASLLPDGRWLLLGGQGENGPRSIASFWDPRTQASVDLPSGMTTARAFHSATVLADGSVLIAGGVGADGSAVVSNAERFNPGSGGFEVLSTGTPPARTRHTATLLADGRVLFTGGIGTQGIALDGLVLWDPRTGASAPLPAHLAAPRSTHTATLLPSGYVLFSDGRDQAGAPISAAELFDPATQRVLPASEAPYGVIPSGPATGVPAIAASLPALAVSDVPIESAIALRFSKALAVTTLNAESVTLIGPNGRTQARVVPAEGGLLLFVTPKAPLQPGANYSLFVNGASDDTGNRLPFSTVSFTTQTLAPNVDAATKPGSTGNTSNAASQTTSAAAKTESESTATQGQASEPPVKSSKPSSKAASHASAQTAATSARMPQADGEIWYPGPEHRRGDWRIKRDASPLQKLPPLQAEPDVTALVGQVLLLDGKAAQGVTLTLGGKSAKTDDTGRFLLSGIPTGTYTLVIDGRSANKPGKIYGYFEARTAVPDAGKTNVLPFTIWMPRIHTHAAVKIPSPTTSEVVITTPHIPGLELHIPKGTVLRDRVGQVVTEVSITPIPVDRPPFPLPTSFVPVYFTIQPGGAHLEPIDPAYATGARLVYPNYSQATPDTALDFWSYDPVDKGWYVYGQGRVSPDAAQVVPDKGVAIYEFTGAMVSDPSNAPPEGPPPDPCKFGQAGDPVDCATGLFLHERTDLFLADTLPIEVRRTYRPRDSRSRSFGIGANLGYDMFMVGDTRPWSWQELILPDGGRIRFNRISPGADVATAVYEHIQSPGPYRGARLEWVLVGPGPWKMTLKDGTVLWFPDSERSTNPRAATPLRLQDRYGNILDFTRDGVGNLTRITAPSGRFIDLTYDTSNRIIQARDHIGRTVTYIYDASGRLWKVTNPEGGIEEYTYDTDHRMLTVKRPNGQIMVTNQYDANGRVIQQTLADGGIYRFAYTLNGNKVTQTDITDPRGNVRRLAFNASGYVVSMTRALGAPEQQTITIERDPWGTNLVLSTTDALNRKTRYTYDDKGNMTSRTRLADALLEAAVTENYTYEPQFSQLASSTDPLGNTTRYSYDAEGNLTDLEDPLGNHFSFAYNGAGQLTRATDPLGHAWTFTYDGPDLATRTDPLGRITRQFRDAAGRLRMITDPLGRRTVTDHDVLDRVVKITDAKHGETRLAWDADGNLTSVTDPRGGVTTYSYDGKDRVTTITNPLGKGESYLYDGNDNRTQWTDRNGKIASFAYDTLNRMTEAQYGQSKIGQSLTTPDATVTQSWDAGDRLTQVTDTQDATITRAYDGLDRLTRETTAQGQVDYAYDAASRRTAMTVLGQLPVGYQYDAASRLTAITQGLASVGVNYDAASRRTSLTLPSGIVATYGYDDAYERTSIRYTRDGTELGDLSYAYNASGERVRIGGSLAHMTLPAPVSSATYNAANQLTQWGGTTFGYDANGDLVTDGTRSYSYDSRHRLSVIGGTATSFAYDAFGRRTKKNVVDDIVDLVGVATTYLYDGLNPVQELRNGIPTVNLLGGFYLDEVFRRTDFLPDGSTAVLGARDLLTDALGSTVALADDQGALTTRYTYTPFGAATVEGPANSNPHQFTGRENDGATGLYYYRARYYDPVRGRFISSDPIGLAGGLNTYAYVLNNPIRYTDPLGLELSACSRPVNGFPYVGNHAYLWDSTTSSGQGMRGSSGSGLESDEKGPEGGDMCKVVKGSAGKEKEVMDFMREHKNDGPWVPFLNDCHNAINDALTNSGLPNPGAPGGRFGD